MLQKSKGNGAIFRQPWQFYGGGGKFTSPPLNKVNAFFSYGVDCSFRQIVVHWSTATVPIVKIRTTETHVQRICSSCCSLTICLHLKEYKYKLHGVTCIYILCEDALWYTTFIRSTLKQDLCDRNCIKWCFI